MDVVDSLSRSGRGFAALVATVSLVALVLQYALLISTTQDTVGPAFATVRYFSYFTILSNLLVALTTGFAVFGRAPSAGRFFAWPRVRGGIALYISIVCGIYFTILRHLWDPQGAQWWADTALHYAVPVLYLAWWVMGATHGSLRWGDVPRWLLFPLAYIAWALIHGAWLHWYPYPFMDVDALGVATALRNIVGMLLLFAVVGAALVMLDRMLPRRRSVQAPT